jgi:hypothetical protein
MGCDQALLFLDNMRQRFRIITLDEEDTQPSRRPRRKVWSKVWSEERFRRAPDQVRARSRHDDHLYLGRGPFAAHSAGGGPPSSESNRTAVATAQASSIATNSQSPKPS